MNKILIIEDEPELVKVLQTYLEKAGFSVLSAYRGDTGLALWEQEKPDLVLLDLNLPGMDGLDVVKNIRKKSNLPILMLTARVEESDEIVGLELGADDYITKPFSPRIVVARVRSLLRRTEAQYSSTKKMNVLDLEIDIEAFSVFRSEQPVTLTPTEFNLLTTLASQPGRVFTRLQLLEAALGIVYEGYERTIDAHIKNLRSKLEPDPKNPIYIETVFGIGYRFRKN